MASPLSTLRKYQFHFMVFFGVVCMLVFVIGDPLDTWLRSRSSSSGDRSENKVVVSWHGGQMRENEIGYTQSVRNVIREFIRRLLDETQKKNGQPRVQILQFTPSEEDIVYTLLLARRGEEVGMVVSDETALAYLEELTANLIPRSGIGEIFRDTVGGKITEQQLLNEIKTELLAQNYISLTYPDLTQGQLPIEAWEYHRRLNRRIKAEVVPVQVAKFKDKVTKQPTEAETEALYNAGKDRYPDPASPDPGFKRPRKAAFDYVKADRKKFEEEETAKLKPQVTDQEIQEYYDKNKIEFRIPDEPPAKSQPDASQPDSTKPDATRPAEPATPPSSDKEPEKAQPEKTQPAPDASKSDPKPDAKSNPKSEVKPEETKAEPQPPADKPAAEKTPPAEKTDAKTDAKKDDQPTEPPQPKGAEPESACTQEREVPDPNADKSAAKADPPAPAAVKDDPKKDATKTEEPKKEEPKKEEPKKAEAKKEEAKKNEETKATPPASATAPTTAPPATENQPAVPAVAPTTPPPAPVLPEPKYKPFDDKLKEEIREKIAKQKAAQAAQQRITKGFDEIRRAVEKYASEKRSAELTGKPVPPPLDVAKLAEQHGMTAGSVPLSDPNKVQETELGKARGYDVSTMSFEPMPFQMLAYRDGIPLNKPDQIQGSTVGGNPEALFLYWKTKEESPFVPALKDIREEVVDAWKLREALVLAETEAKALAEKAKTTGKPLKEVFADNAELKVAETNQFTWMTRGFLPANMGGTPTLSSVDNVEHPGNEFMKSVFKLKPGEVGTAVNQPRTVVHVVRVESELPSEEALRAQFLQTGNSNELQQVAFLDKMEVRRSWFEALRRELNVKWERDPQS